MSKFNLSVLTPPDNTCEYNYDDVWSDKGVKWFRNRDTSFGDTDQEAKEANDAKLEQLHLGIIKHRDPEIQAMIDRQRQKKNIDKKKMQEAKRLLKLKRKKRKKR